MGRHGDLGPGIRDSKPSRSEAMLRHSARAGAEVFGTWLEARRVYFVFIS